MKISQTITSLKDEKVADQGKISQIITSHKDEKVAE